MAGTTVETVAKALNITERRVQQLAKEGMPRASKGEYDLARCMHWYIRYLQAALETRSTVDGKGGTLSLSAERARLAKEQADRIQSENAERAGTLVPAEDVKQVTATAVILFRESVMAIPSRVAPVLAAEMDERRIRTTLDGELRHALESLAKTFAGKKKRKG